jgi:hypothetical protein
MKYCISPYKRQLQSGVYILTIWTSPFCTVVIVYYIEYCNFLVTVYYKESLESTLISKFIKEPFQNLAMCNF